LEILGVLHMVATNLGAYRAKPVSHSALLASILKHLYLCRGIFLLRSHCWQVTKKAQNYNEVFEGREEDICEKHVEVSKLQSEKATPEVGVFGEGERFE
jgi:hypothetical protein